MFPHTYMTLVLDLTGSSLTLNTMLLDCVDLADSEHGDHPTPGGREKEEIISVGSGAHEDTSNVATKSGLPQLLQEVI